MKMQNGKTMTFALTLALISSSAGATRLNEMQGVPSCTPSEAYYEAMGQRPTYIEARWATLLQSNAALFDFASTDKMVRDAHLSRADVSSSHIVNLLAESVKKIRSEELKAIAEGRMKPIIEGRGYPKEELAEYRKSMKAFNDKYVQPALVENYHLYINTLRLRDEARTSPAARIQTEALLARATAQRTLLNQALHDYLPSVVSKFGEIKAIAGDVNDLPFSYRDGVLVKIRLANGSSKISIYPRQLLNQLQGEDDYFLRALGMWRDYCKSQYDDLNQAMQDSGSMFGLGFATAAPSSGNPELDLRKRAWEQAEADLKEAQTVHTMLSQLTDREIYSLLDLFRQLGRGNIPQCGKVVKSMNDAMGILLQRDSSLRSDPNAKITKTSSDPSLIGQRPQIENLAKDIVFYQDMYQVFDLAAARLVAKKSVQSKH